MKKVLDVTPYTYLPFFSGGQKLIARFLEFLGKETNLFVISTTGNDFSLTKNYKGLPWLKPSFFRYIDISLARRIISLVKKENIDTIIWEHPYYAWLAWAVKKRTGVTTILHTHNIEYQRFRSIGKWWWPILKVYEKWFFRFSDLIFFISPEEKNWAVSNWNIRNETGIEVPFGVETIEEPADRLNCRKVITEKHQLEPGETILFFNGLLSYPPNLNALITILDSINPLLMAKKEFLYKIIICGKGLPPRMNSLKDYSAKNIIYAGFVDDITTYFKGADLLLNPVQSGGGIKTKLVEAIGFGTTVIATETGATGIHKDVCGDKLVIVQDNDWEQFAEKIIENQNNQSAVPADYYDYYYWGNIIDRLKKLVQS